MRARHALPLTGLLLFVGICFSDDQFPTDNGPVVLISPVGQDSRPELKAEVDELATLLIDGKEAFTCLTEGFQFANHHLDNGKTACDFYTGSKPRVTSWMVTQGTGVIRFTIRIGEGEPDPDEWEPNPDNSEWVQMLARAARKMEQPEVAGKIGDAYETVSTQIAAGTVRSLTEAGSAVTAAMPKGLGRRWKPLYEWLMKETKSRAQSLQSAQKLFNEIALAMHDAAR